MSSLFRPVAPSHCRLVALSLSWNDRQHDRRWALGVVIDRLIRLDHLGRSERRLARVEVAIEAREVAAGYVDSNSVSGLEDVARSPQINRVFVDLARFNRLRAFGRITVARANDAVGQKARITRPSFV